jgi:hypothetical protein
LHFRLSSPNAPTKITVTVIEIALAILPSYYQTINTSGNPITRNYMTCAGYVLARQIIAIGNLNTVVYFITHGYIIDNGILIPLAPVKINLKKEKKNGLPSHFTILNLIK